VSNIHWRKLETLIFVRKKKEKEAKKSEKKTIDKGLKKRKKKNYKKQLLQNNHSKLRAFVKDIKKRKTKKSCTKDEKYKEIGLLCTSRIFQIWNVKPFIHTSEKRELHLNFLCSRTLSPPRTQSNTRSLARGGKIFTPLGPRLKKPSSVKKTGSCGIFSPAQKYRFGGAHRRPEPKGKILSPKSK
jgi:hypothetical protein